NSPTVGSVIKVPAATAPVSISFVVTDDIEVGTIDVRLDGNQIARYEGDYVDYRRVIVTDLVHEGVGDGSHELTITATDLDGKTTTTNASFSKEPAYVPKYDGEIFYMAFDGNWVDLVGF